MESFGAFFNSNPAGEHLHCPIRPRKLKKQLGMGMGMKRVRVWVCLNPTCTQIQIRFEHTRPIPVFSSFLIPIPTINKVGLG